MPTIFTLCMALLVLGFAIYLSYQLGVRVTQFRLKQQQDFSVGDLAQSTLPAVEPAEPELRFTDRTPRPILDLNLLVELSRDMNTLRETIALKHQENGLRRRNMIANLGGGADV